MVCRLPRGFEPLIDVVFLVAVSATIPRVSVLFYPILAMNNLFISPIVSIPCCNPSKYGLRCRRGAWEDCVNFHSDPNARRFRPSTSSHALIIRNGVIL